MDSNQDISSKKAGEEQMCPASYRVFFSSGIDWSSTGNQAGASFCLWAWLLCKSDLVKRHGVPETVPSTPDTIILDVLQLFYHIVWPLGGAASDLISSIKARYADDADK